MDDVANLPKAVLEHLSIRAFAADADAAADKGPEKEQNDVAERIKKSSSRRGLSIWCPCPMLTRFLATAVTDPLFGSSAASALVAELVDFAAACRLDYAASLVAESASASVCPPSVGGECALGTDVLEDRQEDLEVKRPPGSPPAFKARYVARGFSQRQGVDYFQTFFPTPKMTTLRVLLHVAAQRDYELHSLDFSTAFLQGSLHEEIWLRRPPGFTGSFPAGTQWSLRRPVYGLRQAPRKWHDTLRTTLAALGFAPSTADPSLFLRTDATLPPFYVLVYVDDLVFATADTEALAHVNSNCEAEIYAGAMAAQELRWLTYLLTDLGEAPRSPPVLYVDNKAMLALCQEHRLEHRTKHIALRYFLARDLQ
ncbi:unnamed protein product [Closterium sp. NIES-53]